MSGERKKADAPSEKAQGLSEKSVEEFLGKLFEGASGEDESSPSIENPLAVKLKARIKRQGPITLHDYMEAVLTDPEFGYYIVRDPFGTGGDFITAPDVCQIFGELLGLWCVHVWAELGQPKDCKLVELGPGRGALMSDALRAASLVPEFLNSVEVHFVETSPALRAEQEQRIRSEAREHGREIPKLFWHDRLEDVPQGPTFLLANEFLDALPIRQYQFNKGQWFERMIGVDKTGSFSYLLADEPCSQPDLLPSVRSKPVEGDFVETRPASKMVIEEMGNRARTHPFAGLIIDYGYGEVAYGDSFQAIKNHQFTDPLSDPGLADVTAHVDFSSLLQTAKKIGLASDGPITQREFLICLGVRERAAQLMQSQENMISAQQFMTGLQRLIDPDQMGTLFKVAAITGANQPRVPGFDHRCDLESDLA